MAREIFRANGTYEFCEVVVDQDQSKPFHERTMVVRDKRGKEFTCKPMYGTWGELREWDRDPVGESRDG